MPDDVRLVVAKGQVESIMHIIEALYYGRIAPYEVSMTATPEMEKRKALAARNKDLLRATLFDGQKELLEKLSECVTDISSASERRYSSSASDLARS